MLRVRPAEPKDWARLYGWRNDPATRAASVTQEPVELTAHVKWLEATLKKASVRLFVATDDSTGRSVGTCRMDLRNKTTVELSVTVDARARGEGCSTGMVAWLVSHTHGEFPGVRLLTAQIREENVASLRAFAEVGFTITGLKVLPPKDEVFVNLSLPLEG